MSFPTGRYEDLPSAIASACDRLVHPAIGAGALRDGRRRFVGTMLLAPVLMTLAAATQLAGRLDAPTILAIVMLLIALCWSAVSVAAGTRARAWLEVTALAAAVPALGALVYAAGGLASPAALLLVALPAEAYWVGRTRRALLAGMAALSAAAALQLFAAAAWPAGLGAPAAWHWLLPALYGASLWARAAAGGDAARPAQDAALARRPDFTDGVPLTLTRGGDVIAAGEEARSLLRLAPEMLAGAGLFDRVHVADRIGYMCALDEARDGGSPVRRELRLRLPQDPGADAPDAFQPFSIEFRTGADGELAAMLRDDREIAGLRQALREANERTESLDIAKSRFLAAVSHELRTPLNAIIGFSDILLHEMFGGFSNPRQREYTELIRDSGHHLLAVVNAILDVSRIESGAYHIHAEPFAFDEAAEMCRSMMALQAEKKGVDLRTQIGRGIGEVTADRRAVQQILINLVANAIKFTPEKGSVVLGAQRLGSRLHFWVADTGIGIAEDDLDKIGRPFTQIRNDYTRQFEGTGLGLSLVKGLVALHDGTMSIESAPGEGTKVTISLPVAGPAASAAGGTKHAVAAAGQEVGYGPLRKTA